MRIGLDIDDTITESSELQIEYAKKHFHVDDVDIVRKMLSGEVKGELFNFYNINLGNMVANYHLKANAKEVIARLRNSGHKVIIITARGYTEFSDNIAKITEDYFNKHGIKLDKIVFNKLSKKEACLENKIDIMIDDSIGVLDSVKTAGIKTLLFNSVSNKGIKTNIDRVDNWLELENYINNLKGN
jgi:uncharacterized HAD superfamily protein